MTLIAFKPRIGAVCRIRTAKKDGDAQPPPGKWILHDRHPDPGRWWLLAYDSEARDWAAEHPDEAKLMYRHSSRLVPAREPE